MRQLTKAAILVATPMKKHIYQFTKGCFFVNLLTEMLMGLIPKYYLLAVDRDTSQVSTFFSLRKIKTGKQHRLSSKLSLTYKVNVNH